MSKLTCDNGLPCIFMSKDIGWKAYDPSVETSIGIPFPPTSNSWNDSDTTLYVTISSFRDKLCPITLYNLYTKALYPNRITLGVIQQNLDDDIDCLDNYCQILKDDKEQYDRLALLSSDKDCPFRENIRIDRVNAYEAKGIIVIITTIITTPLLPVLVIIIITIINLKGQHGQGQEVHSC